MRRRVVLLAGAGWLLAGIALVVFNVLVVASAVPATCTACHSVQVATVGESVHASVPCAGCHRGPGFSHLLEDKVAFVGMVARSGQVWRNEPVAATVADDACISCHAAVLEATVAVRALRVQHATIVSGGVRCSECHADVSHGGSLGGAIEMRKCTVCHDGARVSARCSICHIEGERRPASTRDAPNSWRIMHSSVWRDTHGMGDLAGCGVCHPRGVCVRCHGVELPHASGYLRSHAREARDSLDSCMSCHSGERCAECHDSTDTFAHEDGFLAAHAEEVAASGEDPCLRCHARVGCERCHSRHVHPGGRNPDGTFRLRGR